MVNHTYLIIKYRDYKSERRLRLDDAVAQLEESPDLERAMEGWSSARIRAYKALKDKPNTYYYRFNAPGEQQRNGPWTKQEHDLFMKRLEEVGADGQWGIFSMAIPGRVGYQVRGGGVTVNIDVLVNFSSVQIIIES